MNIESLLYRAIGKSTYLPGDDKEAWAKICNELTKIDRDLVCLQKYNAVTRADMKIIGSVDSEAEFSIKKASLSPNSALIINTSSSFVVDGVRFARGDLYYCLQDGQCQHIKSYNGGIYVPSEAKPIDGSINSYQLVYKFTQEIPDEGDVKEIPFTGIKTQSSIYANIIEKNDNVWTSVAGNATIAEGTVIIPRLAVSNSTSNDDFLYPVIRYYALVDDSLLSYEEVSFSARFKIEPGSGENAGKNFVLDLSSIPSLVSRIVIK